MKNTIAKRVTYKCLWGMLKALAMLPMGVLYGISSAACPILYHIVGYRREVVRKNLKNSFPDRSDEERLRIEKEFYHHFCDLVVETVKLIHISDSEMRRRVQVTRCDLVEKAADEGKPVVLMLSHYCNWEWAQEITKRYSRPKRGIILYKPVKDEMMNDLMQRVRARFDMELVPYRQALRYILKQVKDDRKFVAAFISDQRDFSGYDRHRTTFLNQETAFVTGGEDIGRHIDAEFLYLRIKKPCRGHLTMEFHRIEPMEDGEAYPYTRRYLQMLEEDINDAPAYWLWSHNRWKKWRK